MMSMKRNGILFGLVLVAVLLVPSSAWAQSNTGTATAEILQTIKVAAVADLDFGQIVPKQVQGTVTVSASGAVSSSDVFLITPGSPAAWNVTGLAGEGYQIALPDPDHAVLRHSSSGGTTMAFGGFRHNAGSTPTLDGTGKDTFNVGATLVVGANQRPGVYSGTYRVSVAYN